MKLSDTMTATEQQHALTDLLESDGWKLYLEQVAERWGPEASEQAIDAALADCPPDEEKALVSRIRDTFKGVRAQVQWPAERVRSLKEGAAVEAKSVGSTLYAAFRRHRQA